jgi:hypothetical protein
MKKLIPALVFASFAWSLYLVVGVVLGADYALTRAAGGQFDSFPTYLRILYLINTVVIVWQVVVYMRLLQNKAIKPVWTLKAFVILGAIGTLANAASRSADERWNVIPMLITTLTFWRYLRINSYNRQRDN